MGTEFGFTPTFEVVPGALRFDFPFLTPTGGMSSFPVAV
eukprot:CAMPEP_0203791970 /NCGR_PEP_ID=MMETSP0100_2-20121128/4955_1 /ASSEMBLY_ACC=CAM_ASM_000210 /TAXON_ID=96639 /ORGANISM=" , Strain NY0313808BC1" /LENGTH=38 /DNA_ID= /DNA_START= /DNA_END= /DNA_ORIENTATION=